MIGHSRLRQLLFILLVCLHYLVLLEVELDLYFLAGVELLLHHLLVLVEALF